MKINIPKLFRPNDHSATNNSVQVAASDNKFRSSITMDI